MASRPLSPFEKLRQIAEQKQTEKREGLTRPGLEDFPSLGNVVPTPPSVPALPSIPTLPTVPTEPSVPRNSRSERSRQRQQKRQLNVAIKEEVLDRLGTYVYHHRRGLAETVEQAIWEYLETNWGGPTVPRDPSAPTVPVPRSSSMMIDDDDWSPIPKLYETLTGNPMRDSDRAFLNEMKQYGVSCVKLALYIGRSRYRKRINSLRFFGGNILEVAAWEPNKIEKELRYYESS